MKRITPPPVIVQVHKAPERIAEGEEMEFTLWIGPFPLRWLASFEAVGPDGFTDRQVKGPFDLWQHRHSFESLDEQTSRVVDSIEVRFQNNLFWKAVGWLLWLNLPVLFFYRQTRTRQLLEKSALEAG